jgi:hypothetical protein
MQSIVRVSTLASRPRGHASRGACVAGGARPAGSADWRAWRGRRGSDENKLVGIIGTTRRQPGSNAGARRRFMNGWLLDTNIPSDLRRGRPEPKIIAFIDASPLELLLTKFRCNPVDFCPQYLRLLEGSQIVNMRKFARPMLVGMTIASYLTAVPAMAATGTFCFATADGAKHFRITGDFSAATGVGTSLPVSGVDYLASFSPGCAGLAEWPIVGSLIIVNSSTFTLGFHEFNVDAVTKSGCGGTEYLISTGGSSPGKLQEFSPQLNQFFGPFAVKFEKC